MSLFRLIYKIASDINVEGIFRLSVEFYMWL
nr:MAG TPA: hypothetical protein [Crassvirales sp.]